MYLNFEDAYKKYLIYIENKQKNQSKRTLKERFESKILPYWKHFNIYEIKEMDYINWQNEIEKNNYSNNYKKNLHYLMSAFFNFCIKFLQIQENVPKKIGGFKKTYKKELEKKEIYTYKEFKKFINNIDNKIYKSFFLILYFTGIRPGEAMALKFSDLSKYDISINKTIDEHHDKETKTRIINTPKTFSSIRKVQINRFIFKNLKILEKMYIKKYELKEYDYFIFGGIKPLAPTTINRYKKIACKKSELEPIRLHDFRHSHATLLVNKKIPIKVVSKRLGHSKTSTTLDIYVHSEERQRKRVINTLNLLRFNIF